MISKCISKGLEAQLKAEIRANELGYIVSKPTTECCRYDMILDDGENLKRVQVKYCSCKPSDASGAVALNLRKVSSNGNKRLYYTKDEVDAIIVYLKFADCLCYFPINVIAYKQSINIRYEQAKNNQSKNIYYYSDYVW